jgi:hypothetical protein
MYHALSLGDIDNALHLWQRVVRLEKGVTSVYRSYEYVCDIANLLD